VGNGGLALDTKTGQQCWSLAKNSDLGKQALDSQDFPLCYDLYKNSN
jgi:hypothetical protein